MDDELGTRSVQQMLHGARVPQVALDQLEVVPEMVDVAGVTAPQLTATDPRALRECVLGEVYPGLLKTPHIAEPPTHNGDRASAPSLVARL